MLCRAELVEAGERHEAIDGSLIAGAAQGVLMEGAKRHDLTTLT